MDATHELEGTAPDPHFIDQHADQIYGVLHPAVGKPRGMILMAGPLAAERERAHNVTVSWCRRAAQAGFDAYYFDFRGIGESSGHFEDQTLDSWLDDLTRCADWLKERRPDVPLFLLGVRLGAVLTSQAFAKGVGSGLLLWGPPKSARDLMWDSLRHILAADFVQAPGTVRKTREDYARMLEGGELVNVDGYFWSPGLWRSSERFDLVVPGPEERRPWLKVELKMVPRSAPPVEVVETVVPEQGSHQISVRAGRFWEVMAVTPVCQTLFESSVAWLERATAQ
jgi:alpha/beta superfamily hydrolase